MNHGRYRNSILQRQSVQKGNITSPSLTSLDSNMGESPRSSASSTYQNDSFRSHSHYSNGTTSRAQVRIGDGGAAAFREYDASVPLLHTQNTSAQPYARHDPNANAANAEHLPPYQRRITTVKMGSGKTQTFRTILRMAPLTVASSEKDMTFCVEPHFASNEKFNPRSAFIVNASVQFLVNDHKIPMVFRLEALPDLLFGHNSACFGQALIAPQNTSASYSLMKPRYDILTTIFDAWNGVTQQSLMGEFQHYVDETVMFLAPHASKIIKWVQINPYRYWDAMHDHYAKFEKEREADVCLAYRDESLEQEGRTGKPDDVDFTKFSKIPRMVSPDTDGLWIPRSLADTAIKELLRFVTDLDCVDIRKIKGSFSTLDRANLGEQMENFGIMPEDAGTTMQAVAVLELEVAKTL